MMKKWMVESSFPYFIIIFLFTYRFLIIVTLEAKDAEGFFFCMEPIKKGNSNVQIY